MFWLDVSGTTANAVGSSDRIVAVPGASPALGDWRRAIQYPVPGDPQSSPAWASTGARGLWPVG